MMSSAINALDDGVSRTLELVVQTTLDQPTHDRLGGLFAMKGKAGNIWRPACTGHCAMHRLDDVATDRKLPQRLLETRLQAPATGRDLFGEAEPFQLSRAAHHESAKLRILAWVLWAKVGHP